MKLTYAKPEKENWFLVSWTLSNKCNYSCDYCPEHLHSGSTGQPRWETVKRFVEGFTRPGKEICYRISGGEPTYWKHFIDLAKLVKEQGHIFSFITNGSQSIEYFKEISEYTDGMIISYHPKYADLNHIVDIANSVKSQVGINLMMVQDQFDDLVETAKFLYKNTDKLAVWPKVILDKSNIDNISNEMSYYTPKQLDIIKNWPYFRPINIHHLHRGELLLDDKSVNANDLIINGQNKYSGWKCWAGLHMINIDMWGNMYRADCQYGGPIGNLERYKLPDGPITCGKEICACLSDIYVRKEI
tara:strand:+ start:6483 stop:7385 length:903 start_codon:yes stop_codon:yes gene_type:complete